MNRAVQKFDYVQDFLAGVVNRHAGAKLQAELIVGESMADVPITIGQLLRELS